MSTTSQQRFEVLIAGGGVAGLDAALALRDLAAERVAITMLAPEQVFVYRPLRVLEPFAGPEARTSRPAPSISSRSSHRVRCLSRCRSMSSR